MQANARGEPAQKTEFQWRLMPHSGVMPELKPMLLLRLSGSLLLRLPARQFFGLLFQDPPRSTRDTSQGAPQAEACARSMHRRKRRRYKKNPRAAAVNSSPAVQ